MDIQLIASLKRHRDSRLMLCHAHHQSLDLWLENIKSDANFWIMGAAGSSLVVVTKPVQGLLPWIRHACLSNSCISLICMLGLLTFKAYKSESHDHGYMHFMLIAVTRCEKGILGKSTRWYKEEINALSRFPWCDTHLYAITIHVRQQHEQHGCCYIAILKLSISGGGSCKVMDVPYSCVLRKSLVWHW